MPITYRIEESVGLIALTVSGRVMAGDITDYLAASRRDPAFRPSLHRLVVAERVDGFPDLPEVRDITTRKHPGSPHPASRIAAVADSPLGLGMIAMFFGHWGLSDRYRLFDDVPSARAWLLSEHTTDA